MMLHCIFISPGNSKAAEEILKTLAIISTENKTNAGFIASEEEEDFIY